MSVKIDPRNFVILVPLPDGRNIPLRIQLTQEKSSEYKLKSIVFIAEPEKGSAEEKPALEIIEQIEKHLKSINVECQAFMRNTPDGDKVDMLKFLLQ